MFLQFSKNLDNSLLELPNVKKLRLKTWDCQGDRLLMLATVLNSCPSLENLTVEVIAVCSINNII